MASQQVNLADWMNTIIGLEFESWTGMITPEQRLVAEQALPEAVRQHMRYREKYVLPIAVPGIVLSLVGLGLLMAYSCFLR